MGERRDDPLSSLPQRPVYGTQPDERKEQSKQKGGAEQAPPPSPTGLALCLSAYIFACRKNATTSAYRVRASMKAKPIIIGVKI
jgi:hypothetical protein